MVFLIFNNKIILAFLIFLALVSSMAIVSAGGNNLTEDAVLADGGHDNSIVYVDSNAGSSGNGSENSPFSSISEAISGAGNNSRIILKDGVYKGVSNTGLNVDKNLIIESASNGVTIDGESKYAFFNVKDSSNLVLNNIKFVNGYTNDYSQLSAISNKGNLTIANSSFSKMNTVMGVIFNEGTLTITDSKISDSVSKNMAQLITNIGNCYISGSQILDNPYATSGVENGVYNLNVLRIINSRVTLINSNNQYDENLFSIADILISNSTVSDLDIDDAKVKLTNSKVSGRFILKNADIDILESTIDSDFSLLFVSYSNFTAIHSIFNRDISSSYSDLNITYSAILGSISGSGKNGFLYAPYNWWGSNNGPSISYFKNYNVSWWAVLNFTYPEQDIPVSPDGMFTAELNKWFDGNKTVEFAVGERIPQRTAKFETQNGKFEYSSLSLKGIASNRLINNVLDCQVFAVVDSQRLMLTVGKGLSQYTYFVSPDGHDGPEDGSYEKPFLTLQYAVSKVGNGNTICMLPGIHKNIANCGVNIEKNLTIVGLGDVELQRANSRNIFVIMEWGSLVIKNIRFSVVDRAYTDVLIGVRGGMLNVSNCSFLSISTPNVISTSSGNSKASCVVIEDTRFSDIVGSAVAGNGEIRIINSVFEKFSNFYTYSGVESYNCVFPVTKSIEIYGSLFKDNSIGIVNLHPYTYSSRSMLGVSADDARDYGVYAYIENSTFENNVFREMNRYYESSGMGLHIHDDYGSFHGFINNCSFISNKGMIAVADCIDNSRFIDNSGSANYGSALVQAPLINNSFFMGNVNLNSDGEAYVGDGIASGDLIVNSIFIKNKAAFGGAVSATREIHYCVFVNNTAQYEGSDIYSYDGDVDYSTNWWGDNQKPGSEKIFKFLGTLTVNDWVIMTLEYLSSSQIRAGLDHIMVNGSIYKLNHAMPQRPVHFSVDGGKITPQNAYLENGSACANLSYDADSSDFKAYARVDNQILDVDVRNANTRIIMNDASFKGNQNKFNLTLVNVNGYRISNQNLVVEITDGNMNKSSFTIVSDDKGYAEFNVNYPVGVYTVCVKYLGNGFFDKTESTAQIEVLTSITYLNAYNHTYYGKNNRFSAFLTGENGLKLVGLPLTYTITDSKGNAKSITVSTDSYGVGEVLLSLDIGEYIVKCEYLGDSWFSPSSCDVNIKILPVKSNLTVENVTLYGQGNLYNITLRDGYGTLIRGENIYLTISQGNVSDDFTIKTNDDGVASITINYLPGTYNVHARFVGDNLYGPSEESGVIQVEKVLTIVSGFYHATIPLKGLYNVVLTDMNGRRLINQTITLNLYQSRLVKTYAASTDGNGEASFIIDLAEGNYLATMEYGGNRWYAESSNGATIIITKEAVLQNIQINASDLAQYYGENKYFMINFNDPNAYTQYGKEILVTISSGSWNKAYTVYTDVFGLARLQINLNPGEYDVSYKYSNDYYNIFGEGFNRITVYRTPTSIFANNVVVNKGDSRIFEIFLRDVNNNPIRNMQINASIGSKKYNLTTNDEGIAKLVLNLDVGTHTIRYSFDNPNYISSASQSTILVVDSDKSPSTLSASDITALDNQTLNLTVDLKDMLGNGIASSQVSLLLTTFEGEVVMNTKVMSDDAGHAIFRLRLDSGNYIAKLTYGGNNFYLGSSAISVINVNASDSKIKTVLFAGDTQLSDSSRFYVALSDENGTVIRNADVRFIINNKEYSSRTDESGRAYLNRTLSPNIYVVKAFYDGDMAYRQSQISSKIYISSITTQLHAQKLVKYYRNGTQFHAVLLDGDDNPISGKTISVMVNGGIYNCTTDVDGWITLEIDFKPGFYEVECSYYADDVSQNSFDRTNITVLSTVMGNDVVKYYGDAPYMNITFLDGTGSAIENSSFIINIDGKNYHALINEKTFLFDLNLDVGEHMISVTNPYDGLSASYRLTVLPTVEAGGLTKVINSKYVYVASFLDKKGNVLKNTDVDIIINGIRYSYKTDSMGKVKLDMNMKPGNYRVTAINPKTGDYVENDVRVLPSIVSNKNMAMYYGSAKAFKVKIIGNNAKAVGAGKTVKFKINGKSYKVKTNKKGYASLKIKLNPKKYTVITSYNGYKVSNRITVKPLLFAKNVSVKKSKTVKFKAKLVDSKGKPQKSKKITFKIKNKKYLAKTNKKGIAILKLKLKPGKYVIKSSYGKSKISNRIVVKN